MKEASKLLGYSIIFSSIFREFARGHSRQFQVFSIGYLVIPNFNMSRPSTANPINMGRLDGGGRTTKTFKTSTTSTNSSRPQTSQPKSSRKKPSSSSRSCGKNKTRNSGRNSGRKSTRSTLNHSPPRFLMDGAQLPFGKNAGLAAQQGPILSLSGKVFVPLSWTGFPKHKSKKDLYQKRRIKDKIQQNELQSTLDDKLNIVKRPTLKQTYGRVLAGCVPIPVTTDTQSELFRTRSEQYLSSITDKSKRRDALMANHPSKKRQKQAIKEQVRSWEKNKAGKSRYEQLIAPIGRDSEMGRKTMWTKEHHPYIGPGYRAKPTYPTKKALNQSRAREINELVITKINESWNKTQELAVRNEKIARSASLSTHVPFHNTQSELFAARALQPVKEAEILRQKAIAKHIHTQSTIMDAPEIARGWWQKKDEFIQSSDVLNKGSCVRLRTIAQRAVQPEVDPFKQYETSIHSVNRTRNKKQRSSVELAVVDRTGPEWTQGASHLPKQPSIPVKRWSDVVIEFQQADAKLDDQRMGGGGEDGGGGGGGGNPASLDDVRPLYSSFTADQIFREPEYTFQNKSKHGIDQQASFVLQPLGAYNLEGTGSKRALTLMQRSRRASRFRDAYAQRTKGLGGSIGGGSLGVGSINAASSFGAVPMTPGQNDREKFRDCGSSRGNPSRQGGGLGGFGDSLGGRGGGLGVSASSMSDMASGIGSGFAQSRPGAQSMPVLTEQHQKSRARTAPGSSRQSKKPTSSSRKPGTPSGLSRGSPSGLSRGSSRQSVGPRPGTAPLRMTKRPGTAVRTRGFFEEG